MNIDDGSFLSDTFWPMAIGQFGWIGSFVYTFIYLRVFSSFKKMRFNSDQKAFSYASYLQYMIHAIGAAILSTSAGMIGAIALSMIMKPVTRDK